MAAEAAKCLVHLGKPLDQRPTAKELNRILTKYCPQWKSIGLHLGLTKESLEVIELNHHHVQPNECFRDTLHRWLEIDVNASWRTLELCITNARREKEGYDPLDSMPPMQSQSMSPQSQSMSPQSLAQPNPMPNRNHPVGVRAHLPQGSTNGAGIQPEFAPTTDAGKGIVKDTVFTEVKRAVCRINASMVGTGFIAYMMLRDRYSMVLVSNNHVITTEEDAMGSRLTFENALPDCRCVLQGCKIFVPGSFWCSPMSDLDYTVIEIYERELIDPFTTTPLNIIPFHLIRPTPIKDNDQVHVIQHPHGGELSFSSSESYVESPLLLYQCTTEEGSSGSPVLKEVQGDLKVVALHRGGRNGSYSGAIDFNCGTLIEEINNRINGIPTTPLPSDNRVAGASGDQC